MYTACILDYTYNYHCDYDGSKSIGRQEQRSLLYHESREKPCKNTDATKWTSWLVTKRRPPTDISLMFIGTPFRFKRFQPLCISWTDQTPVHDAMLEGNTSSRIEEAGTWKTPIELLFCFSFSTLVLESASIESGLQLQVWASSTVQFWLKFTFHPTNSSFSKCKKLHSPRESAHKPPIFYLCFWDMLATDKLCNQAVHILRCQH